MKTDLLVNFSIDMENKRIDVEREFAAPLSKVWAAWTESVLLDQWWAPKPWKTTTKTMDFKEGGYWLYTMEGPDGTKHWSRADYKEITPLKSFSGWDAFCDQNGTVNTAFPITFWTVEFSEKSNSTLVSIEIKFDLVSDLEKMLEMGFKERFTSAMENLDELLDSGWK